MKKKAIAVLTALTLTLGLAACGGSGTAPAAEPEEAAEETAEEETTEVEAEAPEEETEEAAEEAAAEPGAAGPNSWYQIDSDDLKLVAMDNAMVRYAREYYWPEEDTILIPAPCVVYESDMSEDTDRYGEWGTFPIYAFVYDPETLMMKMTGASFSTGVIILEGIGGEFLGEWTPAETDEDQAALEKEYGVEGLVERIPTDSGSYTESMEEALKAWCAFNGYTCVGYVNDQGEEILFEE